MDNSSREHLRPCSLCEKRGVHDAACPRYDPGHPEVSLLDNITPPTSEAVVAYMNKLSERRQRDKDKAVEEQSVRQPTYAELIESLEKAGYKKYDPPAHANHDEAWQKCVRVDGRKAYFLNVNVVHAWLLTLSKPTPVDLLYDADCQFWLTPEQAFNVHFLAPFELEEMEAFYADIFEKMNCRLYDEVL